jgi:hypothetical protein
MTKQQIIKKTREWVRTLCCSEIDLSIVFRKFSKKEIAEYSDGNFTPIAFVYSNARYLESTIYFNQDKLKIVNDEVIVHEILHIKLNELSGYLYANEEKAKADQWKGYFEERFVSQMAKIITRL